MRRSQLAFVLGLVAAPMAPAMAEVHFDISPQLVGGQIAINGVTHASTENPFTGEDTSPAAFNYFAPNMRVFGYELGEDPLFPTSAEDPGINNEAGTYVTEDTSTINLTGTGLPLGSVLSFTIESDLQYWNGAGFSAVPDAETLELVFGSTRTAGMGTGELAPLPVKTFTSNDHVHLHLGAELLGNGGVLSDPTVGVYLLQARLESSSGSVGDSESFWILYNFGADEEVHEEAIAWAENNFVPEPVSAGVLALSGLGMVLMRRR